MDSPQAKTMLLLEADGERDSNLKKAQQFSSVKYFWPLKHRFVEFNEVEKHYKKLEEECRHYKESIKKIKEGDNTTDRQAWHNQHKNHQELHQGLIARILAWKNDKLILGLKALKCSNKQSNNLQILMRHSIRSLKSEKNILKEVRNIGDHEQPKNCDAIRDAMRALEEPNHVIWDFEYSVGCYCWRGYNKTFMTPQLRTEFEGIMKDRKIWMGRHYCFSSNKKPPDEEQMKKLLQDTTRLMCIIREVTEKVIVLAVHENKKYVDDEKEKLKTSLENKLKDLELRQAEVSNFMSKWKEVKKH
ncbi:hypothetical protein ACFE04_017038 [Oxalis oulophora]